MHLKQAATPSLETRKYGELDPTKKRKKNPHTVKRL